MRIVIGNLPDDVTEDSIREALAAFAPAETVLLTQDGSTPTAVIEIEMTHTQAEILAKRIQGRLYKGRPLSAWVPAMGWK